MPCFVRLSVDDTELERQADALLEGEPRDPERPAYTETQLCRRGKRMVSIRHLAETMPAMPQEMEDELRFIISVSPIKGELKRCLQLWLAGWTQDEIARAYGITQQLLSRRLQKALQVAYDHAPLAFRHFSHHTVYRRPRKGREAAILRRCAHCDEEYPLGNGFGRYCSQTCRETARHDRESRRRTRP